MKPAEEYHRPTRRACSPVFHQDEVMTMRPGLRGASKTPRKNRHTARPAKFVAAPEHARTIPVSSQHMSIIKERKDAPTPQNEVDSDVLSCRKLLHQEVGRVLGNQIPNVEQSHQQTVFLTLKVGLLNKAIGCCSGKCLKWSC